MTSLRRSPDLDSVAVRLVREDRTYVRRAGERLETDLGVLEVPADVRPGDTLETHLGHAFAVRELRLRDCFEHFERTGAPMLPRDIGLVLGLTGIRTGDRVLDIGTGTGVLAAGIGLVGANVVSYERDADAAETARENMTLVGVDDCVTVRNGDGLASIDTDELDAFDAITLDTGDAPTIAKRADELLVPGGYLAAYSPFVEQTRAVVEAARESLTDVRAIDTIQRELDVDPRGTRPTTSPVGHTGYLTIARQP